MSKLTTPLQHCAHFQESELLSTYEKQYMLNRILPPPDTTCEVDQPDTFFTVTEQGNATTTAL